MKRLQESPNQQRWPRMATTHVETRKRDLVIRITDWTDDADEPAYDVECYIGGIYDWNESQSFTRFSLQEKRGRLWKAKAKSLAIAYAQKQIKKLL